MHTIGGLGTYITSYYFYSESWSSILLLLEIRISSQRRFVLWSLNSMNYQASPYLMRIERKGFGIWGYGQ